MSITDEEAADIWKGYRKRGYSNYEEDCGDFARWAYEKGKLDTLEKCELVRVRFNVGDTVRTPEGVNRKIRKVGGVYYELDHSSEWRYDYELKRSKQEVLRVGDKIKLSSISSAKSATILAIGGDKAWVQRDYANGDKTYATENLSNLERVE